VDDFTDINMTEYDYIQLCVKRAIDTAISEAKETIQHHIHDIEEAIENWRFVNLDSEHIPSEDKPKAEEHLKWLMNQIQNPDAKWMEL
jgi:hypothetical protein